MLAGIDLIGVKECVKMTLCDRLYEHVKDIWEYYYTHPFITAMIDGTLPKEKFRFYSLQDYHYLLDYAKSFAAAVAKADSIELLQKLSSMVYYTLNTELDTQRGILFRLGLTPEELDNTEPSLTTVSYARYMMSVAYEKGALETMVSLLPCAWSYQLLGERIGKSEKARNSELYGDWVRQYSDGQYAKNNEDLIAMINKSGEGCSEAKFKELKFIMKNSSRYESMFWDMAWNMTM
jgi:thiaminase/transcriptional activator TenA